MILSRLGLSGLVPSVVGAASPLLGLLELAMEKTPESAWLAGESLLDASRGDSTGRKIMNSKRSQEISNFEKNVIFKGNKNSVQFATQPTF